MDISGNLAGDLIMMYQEELEQPREYDVEDLLEMLGGDQYYSMDKVMFVYHTLRNEDDEAAYYKDIMDKKDVALNKKLLCKDENNEINEK